MRDDSTPPSWWITASSSVAIYGCPKSSGRGRGSVALGKSWTISLRYSPPPVSMPASAFGSVGLMAASARRTEAHATAWAPAGQGSAQAGMRISPSIQRMMFGNASSGISDSRQ